ncbi:magnesium chelatase, H subunit [Luminiphilus syltensis NOR5-1B]|uniref:magnesium chelatase n=1 Tax=Luminiphilus syltensis NOR5-1B TaxID=565045 RepID=B8KT38_9GAMM|nr:magnesium chelatase, H subunit [Luminiphilus syltensis NOR5-1B]
MHVAIITLDNHVRSACDSARNQLGKRLPGLELSIHAASDWEADPDSLKSCHADIAAADIVVATMLFMEPHIDAVIDQLRARRDHCDAMICCMSAAEVMKLTRMGRFSMDREATGPIALLKRLRGSSDQSKKSTSAQQLSVLRQLPKILRFIPGTAQDVRAYFLTLQYWLSGSSENIQGLVEFLVSRYAADERAELREVCKPAAPVEYPENGVYHPGLKKHISDDLRELKTVTRPGPKGTVGLLIMRSYALSGDAKHYDAVIEALEEKGLSVIPAFASGLDARPAVDRFFVKDGVATVDCVVSLTGFSLVGGPAYNDSDAAQEMLASLDVPYLAVQPLEFQSLEDWQGSNNGLMPIEATMMVAIPELDGATSPLVFGGRSAAGSNGAGVMKPHPERIDMLASRIEKLVVLRREERAARKVAVVLFNFPPNAGNTGTAASLSVFQSLYNTLKSMSAAGYTVEVPDSVDALREHIISGNASRYGVHANVHTEISVDDHVRREPYLEEIESQWGAAPGKSLTNGRSIFVLGAQFGNVLVTVQPPMGYEGDPMRLLFEGGFAPTHAFSAFYRYLREDFAANAVLHFGTHGALEFMPGKQVGLSAECWPDRLIGDLPNFYLYAANNPSEGLIAKRRSAATLISYLTPSVANADLYKGLLALKDSVDKWRSQGEQLNGQQRIDLALLIQAQAATVDLADETPEWSSTDHNPRIDQLRNDLLELEQTLIPHGLHTIGAVASMTEQRDTLRSMAAANHGLDLSEPALEALLAGDAKKATALCPTDTDGLEEKIDGLARAAEFLQQDTETPAIIHALDGGFIRPVAGGDLMRSPEVLPTGRNIHGFDPYRLPSVFALGEGARQAQQVIDRHVSANEALPESIALVLWGTDNLKTEGEAIAQALALMGATPRVDSYGKISGAKLLPLEALGRPRIDVVITLSGIFRDLLPIQTRLLAEAAWLAATADEPLESNFIRKHALAYQAEHDCDMETAALRVFSNSEGTYGSNVNLMIDEGCWEDEAELGEAYTKRKGFAYARSGAVSQQSGLLTNMLAGVDLAYQNLDSVELGVTTVDHYFDTLGGISRTIQSASGRDVPVYISDQTTGNGKVRTLNEQVALETRTRVLNPKWYESMLEHGFEGVRNIETHISNTMGWSATTGQVAPWVYQRMSETFVLDEAMRDRLAALNPTAAAKVASRLLEAQERQYWNPDQESLDALRRAGEDLEDYVEGVAGGAAA